MPFSVALAALGVLSPARAAPRFAPLEAPAGAKIAPEVRDILQEVNADIKKGDKDEAGIARALKPKLARINKAARRRDLDPRVRERFSTLNLAMDRPEDAKEISGVTLASDPGDRDALNNRALAHYALKDYKAAVADAGRVVQEDPSNERAYTTRAMARYAEGNYLQAAEDARRALALDKDNETAFYVLKIAQSRLHPPNLRFDAIEQARAEQVQREYQLALEHQNEAEASLKDAPANVRGAAASPPEAWSRQASQNLAERNYWGAIVAAGQALSAHPGDARAHYLRAAAYNLVGRCQDGLQDADAALASPSADAFNARSVAQYCLGRYPEAAGDARRAIAMDPGNAYAYANRARAFERMLDFPAALADHKKAAELNPQFEPAYRLAVSAYGDAAPAKNPRADARKLPVGKRPGRGRPALPWLLFFSGGLFLALGLAGAASRLGRPGEGPARVREPAAFLRLQNYRILRPLAEGGMGIVYEAVDEALGRPVAIKRMRDEIKLDRQARERFLREARTVAALRHPNIVEIYSILESPDDLFLVFEYIPGRLLRDLLREGPPSPAELRGIFRGACSALDFAHRHGIIHRDLKPANIMIAAGGEVKVMDFGIAHQARLDLARAQTTSPFAGTLHYMAPEAQDGVIRPESDVFALGVCLHETLFGGPPAVVPRPAGLAQGLADLLDTALEPNPDRRLPSPGEFFKRLDALEDAALAPRACAAPAA